MQRPSSELRARDAWWWRVVLFVGLLFGQGCVHNIYKEEYRCHRYLVAPPYHVDPYSSDLVREIWMHAALADLRPCDSFVGPDVASTVLNMIGLDHRREMQPERLEQQQRNVMGLQAGATHLVILDHRRRANGQLRIKAKILRLYDMQEEQLAISRAYSNKPEAAEEEVLVATAENSWLYEQIDLIPNTVTFGTVTSLLDYPRDSRVDPCEDPREVTLLPPLLSSLGLTNVSHPYGYRKLDFAARWFPALDLTYFNTEYVFARSGKDCAEADATGEQLRYRLEFLSLPVTLNGEVALFWPLGTTYLQVGAGASLFFYRDDDEAAGGGGRLVGRIAMGHRVFFKPQWMVQVSYDEVVANRPWFRTSVFKAERTHRTFVGFGYFFPTSRNVARRLGSRLFGR